LHLSGEQSDHQQTMPTILHTAEDMCVGIGVLEPSHIPSTHVADLFSSHGNLKVADDTSTVAPADTAPETQQQDQVDSSVSQAAKPDCSLSPTEASRKRTQGIWWYLRHPWLRLTSALLIFFLDFLYYAEDPIVHSHLTSEIPVGGQFITMLVSRWPSTGALCFLKVFWGWASVFAGAVVGRLVHRKLLSKCNMFENSNGTWTVMLIFAVITVWIGSYPYNAMVGSDEPQVTSDLNMKGYNFGLMAQMCTWIGDVWTLIMVWDSMLQDDVRYPEWLSGCFKEWWGKWRILGCWFLAVVPTAICFSLMAVEEQDETNNWDSMSTGSNEVRRWASNGHATAFAGGTGAC